MDMGGDVYPAQPIASRVAADEHWRRFDVRFEDRLRCTQATAKALERRETFEPKPAAGGTAADWDAISRYDEGVAIVEGADDSRVVIPQLPERNCPFH